MYASYKKAVTVTLNYRDTVANIACRKSLPSCTQCDQVHAVPKHSTRCIHFMCVFITYCTPNILHRELNLVPNGAAKR